MQNIQQPYLFKEEEMRPFMLFMLLLDLFLKDVMSAPFGQFIRAAVEYCQKTTCVKSYDYKGSACSGLAECRTQLLTECRPNDVCSELLQFTNKQN